MHIVDDFNNFVTFRNFMLKLGKRMKAEDPERVLLLIPCGDVYANLLSQCGDDLREYFVYNTLDVNLSRRLATSPRSTRSASSMICPIRRRAPSPPMR